jgi:hypothetical protein
MWTRLRTAIETGSFKNRLNPSLRSVLGKAHRTVRTAIEYHQVQHLLIPNRSLEGVGGRRDRCFILCTGPSLQSQDLTPLRGETLFAVNGMYLHPQYDHLDPAYHFTADPQLGVDRESNVAWLRDLEQAARRPTFVFPAQVEPLIRKHGLFQGRKIHYLFFSEEGCESGRIRSRLTRPMSVVSSVSLACLLVAIEMGIRTIYLLGCDHDWLANPSQSLHFYGPDPHFVDDSATYPYEIVMESQLRLWKAYRHVREFALKRGIRIYNATRGGYLDVFPRVNYEQLMSSPPESPRGEASPVSVEAGGLPERGLAAR